MGEPARWSAADSSAEPPVQCALDKDFDEWTAWLDREAAAGRNPVPPRRTATQGISVDLGEADGVDPQLLAAICDPDGDGLGPQFGQDAAADVLPPGPVLAALTEAAVTNVTCLSDSQLVGVLQAARRQENREAWKKALVIGEFTRRRQAEFDAATARGVPVHCRPGQFAGEELAVELLLTSAAASHAIDDATDLATRLPRTLAGMAAGLIDEDRAGVIAFHTRSLSTDDVALADEILAALAPALRLDQLQGKALALEKKLNSEGVKARQEYAKRTRQRVEVRREESGNASVAGREMDISRALASKAYMHGLALQLRHGGLPGTLDQLRLAVFEDLTSGRDPMDRLTQGTPWSEDSARDCRQAPPDRTQAAEQKTPPDDGPDPECGPPPNEGEDNDGDRDDAGAAAGSSQPGSLDYDHEEIGDSGCPGDPAFGSHPRTPVPAMINLVVHAGTLFGWDTVPAEAGDCGLLDVGETPALVAAASRHPATRWCLTLLVIFSFRVGQGCDLRRPVVDSVADGTIAA